MLRRLCAVAIVLSSALPLPAQLPRTRLYALSPAGAAPGTISEVAVTSGEDLDELERLDFSHPGIFATPLLRGDGLAAQRVKDVFRVAVDPAVPPGRYDVRAVGLFGMSNPRTFLIDPRPVNRDTEPNNAPESAQAVAVPAQMFGGITNPGDVDVYRFRRPSGAKLIISCDVRQMESRLDPQITVMDERGHPLASAFRVGARDPLLVLERAPPGDVLLKIHDRAYRGGSEFGYRLLVHAGPHVHIALPAAAQPGTPCRMTLLGFNLQGGTPTSLRSAGGQLERTDFSLSLAADGDAGPSRSSLTSIAAGLDLIPLPAESLGPLVEAPLIARTPYPVVREADEDELPLPSRAGGVPSPQRLEVPCDLTGQLSRPGDVDQFEFSARSGEEWIIEVVGHRLGSPIDPYFIVERVTRDAQGSETLSRLTSQDDETTNLAAQSFDTASDDPTYRLRLEQDGDIRLSLRDRAHEHRGDPSHVYRLIVRRPAPNVHVIALPAGQMSGRTAPVVLRRSESAAFDLLALRQDGWDGPIEVRARDLPPGLTAVPGLIRAGDTKGQLIVQSADTAVPGRHTLTLEAFAEIAGPHGLVRHRKEVLSGGFVWTQSANMPATSRVEPSLAICILSERAPFWVTHELPAVTLTQGRQLFIPLRLQTGHVSPEDGATDAAGARTSATVTEVKRPLKLGLSGLPGSANIDVPEVSFDAGDTEKTARLFVSPKTPPGTYVLRMTAEAQVGYSRNPVRAAHLAVARDQARREVELAQQELDRLSAELQAAEEGRRPLIEGWVADARADVARLQERLRSAEKGAAEAADAAKPRDLPVQQPVTPVVITVLPSPIALEVEPARIELKRGEAVDVSVRITRQNGFSGPVRLSLAGPPITDEAPDNQQTAEAAAATIPVTCDGRSVPAEEATGVLTVTAPPDAPLGDVRHLVVRGIVDSGGEVIVEVPLSLKVIE